MRNKVLIYRDYGCADVTDLQTSLQQYFADSEMMVELTDAASILKESALDNKVAAFFMPGGAATPYRMKLGCLGNEIIRSYVKQGGIYFGICAGAYYASRKTEFETDVPDLAVIDEYGLDLIDAHAIGTLKKAFGINHYSLNPSSSAVTSVTWNADGESHSVFYHGGPYLDIKNPDSHEVLAVYRDVKGTPPAVVERRFGNGLAIVSGVHFEDGVASLKGFVGRTIEDRLQAEKIMQKMKAGEEGRLRLRDKMLAKISGR